MRGAVASCRLRLMAGASFLAKVSGSFLRAASHCGNRDQERSLGECLCVMTFVHLKTPDIRHWIQPRGFMFMLI